MMRSQTLVHIIFAAAIGGMALLANAWASGRSVGTGAGDWSYVNHDTYGTRYSALQTVTTANANRLHKICTYAFPE
jgi:glucose dehydrogenase